MKDETLVLVPERTEEEFTQAVNDFLTASGNAVGIENTFQALKVLTNLVESSPGVYRKLFNPATIERLEELVSRTNGKKVSTIELMGLIPEVLAIFQ